PALVLTSASVMDSKKNTYQASVQRHRGTRRLTGGHLFGVSAPLRRRVLNANESKAPLSVPSVSCSGRFRILRNAQVRSETLRPRTRQCCSPRVRSQMERLSTVVHRASSLLLRT